MVPTRVTLRDGSQEWIDEDDLEAAAEMFDRLRDEIDEDNHGFKKEKTDDGH